MTDFSADIRNAIEVLRKGGVILYPTDTIWGIGCDATNAEAVQRIYEIKKRQDSMSMLVLLENPNLILSYIEEMPDVAWDLIDFAEKPTTIIYDKAKNLAKNLIANDGTIGIRISKEAFTQQLIQKFRKPLVSTSANISGSPSPQNFNEISDEIKSKVDYIVAYRQEETTKSAPSSIIKLGASGLIKIIRE
ncbi:MAG TPA: L-threonylcarbamoyladenylate synthase [Prolixibacteraceae bacterium]|nr:L-threonylcarbamoyladenylate synthase [Prolixibacteraceae bacterium]